MPPVLILLKGYAGSGKSTLGRALASKLGFPLIDKDDARDGLQQYAHADSTIDWNTMSYDIMFNYVNTQLRCGLDVIVDCPFARRQLFNRLTEIAHKYDAKIVLIEVIISDKAEHGRRLEQRAQEDANTARSHKPGSLEVVEAMLRRNNGSEKWSDELTSGDIQLRVTLDTATMELNEQVDKVLEALKQVMEA